MDAIRIKPRRTPAGWVVVLGALILLGSQFVGGAVASIAQLSRPAAIHPISHGGGPAAAANLVAAYVAYELLAVGAVVFVSRYSQRSDLRALGLVLPLTSPSARLRLVLGTVAYVAISYLCGHWNDALLQHLHVTYRPAQSIGSHGAPGDTIALAVSINAGLCEELQLFAIPLALLAWARPHLGRWTTPVTVVTIEVLRMSIHLYYGWRVTFVIPWMLLALLLYRRIGTIWPLIAGHAIYDALLFLGTAGHTRTHPILLALVWIGSGSTLALLATWRRRAPVPVWERIVRDRITPIPSGGVTVA